jgi:hypothetical protein
MIKPALLFLALAVALTHVATLHAETTAPRQEPQSDYDRLPLSMYQRHMLGFRIEYLHRINIGDIDGLRSELQESMVWDCYGIWQLLEQGNLTTSEERASALAELRLIAIQSEKDPVPKWKDNARLQSIFRAAIADNPEHAASLRANNWKRPMWLP